MDMNQLIQEIDAFKNQIPIKQKDLSVFERIDLYTKLNSNNAIVTHRYEVLICHVI